MATQPDLVTIFRSMDITAQEDCEIIIEQLEAEGLHPAIVDDTAPGVPEGVYEVRVPAAEASRADQIIAANPLPDEVEEVDNSAGLDLETVFHSEGSSPSAEVEAMAIKNVLESNGIAVVIVGDSVLPNLPFEVKVARAQAERARRLIAEAETSGPAAAEEAASETEIQAKERPE